MNKAAKKVVWMSEAKKKSKIDQLLKTYADRVEQRKGISDDWEGLHKFLDAAHKELLKESKKEKEQTAK